MKAAPQSPAPGPRAARWRPALLVLAAVSLLLLTYRLDGTPFRGLYDDVNRSLIARNMVESGDWLVARSVRGPLYTKPPLMYWTAAAIGLVTGRDDELPGNLTSAVSMFLLVLATFWAGRNLFGTRAGLWAGLLLVTMHLFLAMGRQALLDTPMLAGFGLSFGAVVHLAFSGTTRTTRWWLAAALGLAVGFMTKGPVILPPFLLLLVPLLVSRPGLRPRPGQLLGAALVIAAITLPWPLALLRAAPEAGAVWRSEFFGRFGDGSQFHAWTQKPAWFYLPDLLNTLPWLPVLLWAVMAGFRRRRDPRLGFLLWWAVGGLVFFSLASATKRSYYLLPLYPAFALLMAGAWTLLLEDVRRGIPAGRAPRLAFGASTVLLAVAGSFLVVLPFWKPLLARAPLAALGAATTVGGILATVSLARGALARVLPLGAAAAACLHLAYFGHYVPVANTYHSGKPFYTEAVSVIGDEPVIVLEHHIALSAFYLHRVPWRYLTVATIGPALAERPGSLVIAKPESADRVPGLELVFAREFAEPFGQTRRLGLYRHRPPGSADGGPAPERP